jgi:hypothetical protein
MIIDKIFITLYTAFILFLIYAIYLTFILHVYCFLIMFIPFVLINIGVLIYIINEYKNNHTRISQ